jgi:FAD/FMN-containing dehydrogenase
MNQQVRDELQNVITGEVILPASPGYDELRNVFNQNGSPSVIVRCQTNEDVSAAIRYARDNQLKLSIRSGGHASSGLSTNDGGVVIDLSQLNAVEVLDAKQHLVRVGAGAHWGDSAKAMNEYGLVISSGDTTSVGVGGLTLGGGIGWLVRKYGLTIDHLQAAEIVTADGETLRVSEQEHPDLFWAIRGGGGNFGVVTSFDFRAQPLKSVVGGMVIYGLDEMESILPKWRDYMRGAPEELTSTVVVFPGFGEQMPPSIFVSLCYGGEDEAAANAAIKPLQELGTVRQQNVERKPYYKILEEPMAPPGIRAVNSNGFVKTMSKDVLAAIGANYGRPKTAIIQIRSLGGAMARVKSDATAFAHRDYEAFILAASLGPKDMPQEQVERMAQEAWQSLKPFTSGAYINFLSDVSDASVKAAYPTATYARLAKIKAKYDPDNVFNQNHNIKPAKS